jgi:hypothetical protein
VANPAAFFVFVPLAGSLLLATSEFKAAGEAQICAEIWKEGLTAFNNGEWDTAIENLEKLNISPFKKEIDTARHLSSEHRKFVQLNFFAQYCSGYSFADREKVNGFYGYILGAAYVNNALKKKRENAPAERIRQDAIRAQFYLAQKSTGASGPFFDVARTLAEHPNQITLQN